VFILSLLVILFVSFNNVKASSIIEQPEQGVQKLEQIKEKRADIKKHERLNKKLENQVKKKDQQIDRLLVELYENNLIPQEMIENQMNDKLEFIMSQAMQIGEEDMAYWKHIKKANRQIEAKKYDLGIKNLDYALGNLEKRHEMLINFLKDLDDFHVFLNSLQHK
jgi:hypothetical protein